MFQDCTSLISLNFQNLDISSIENIEEMFKNCKNLEFIDIKNFKSLNNNNNYNFLSDCPINIAVCIENETLIDKVKNNDCYSFDCSDNAYKLRKKIYNINKCTDNCSLTNYKFEYEFKCRSDCPSGTYINKSICENCHEDCKKCDGPYTTNNTNCISCSLKHVH